MEYGQHARDLVNDLKRTDVERSVPPYNDVSVQACLQDTLLHGQALEDQVAAAQTSDNKKLPMEFRPSIFLQKAACERNKRGLVLYHWERLQRIQEQCYWNTTHTNNNNDKWLQNLCPAETAFLQSYHTLVQDYTEAVLGEDEGTTSIIDLRLHGNAPPPMADRVLVRVVNDDENALFGDGTSPILLESGQTVTLTKGSVHYLLYGDAQEYLRMGALQLLETEEQ